MEDQAVGVVMLVILGAISLGFLGLFIWSLVWCYQDAEKRGKPGCLVALLVAFLSWPISLLLWIVARPDRPNTGRPMEDGLPGPRRNDF